MLRLTAVLVFAAGLCQCVTPATHAVSRSWDSGGTNENWSTTANWSPNGDPGADDLTIGDILQGLGAETIVDQDYTISSLTLMGGASVDTNSNNVGITGAASISEANTTLILRERTSSGTDDDSFDVNSLFLGTGSTIQMHENSILEVDNGVFNLFGTLIGNGTIELLDDPAAPASLLNNTGTISAGRPLIFLGSPPPLTLQIVASDADARLDLDGAGAGEVFVQENATLDIDLPLFDAFSGTMSLGPNATLSMSDSWQVDGDINVNTSSFTLTERATIGGGQLTLNSGATMTLDENDESLRFAAQLSANNGSTLANSGTVIFDASAQFAAMADFQLLGSAGSMVVNAPVTLVQDEFDVDGDGQVTNQVTVNPGGLLTIDVGNFGGGTCASD